MVLAVVAVVALLAGAAQAQPAVLLLERLPVNKSELTEVKHLVRRGLVDGRVLHLPVIGTGSPYFAGGPYLTRVQLGNPRKDFNVLIDTGSSMTWITCQTAGVSPGLSSSTASVLPCSDRRCGDMIQNKYAVCRESHGGACEYDLFYGHRVGTQSSTSGYYLSDVVYLEFLNAAGQTFSTPTPIVFGCTTSRSAELASAAFDGVFGFGPHKMSFSSQLQSLGLSPGIFSLCMKSSTGGGILVFGEMLEPGIVYTPLLPSMISYKVHLESIAMNGHDLPIDPSVFRPSGEHKTFVDSGTTLVYLADGAYDPFVNAIASAVPPSVRSVVKNEDSCFVTSSSVDSLFPTLTLRFAGGAAMTVKPNNYLRSEDQTIYCIAWLRNHGTQITVLGDIVLMDKIIVHDTANMRLGWKDFDCSQSVNVTSSIRKNPVNSGYVAYNAWVLTGVAIALAHISHILCNSHL